VKYKRAMTKADFLVTLVCIILAFLNLGGLSSIGRERARRMVCAVNMARLAQANHVYADNWDEQFCPPMMENRLAPRFPQDERRENWLLNNDFRKYLAIDEKSERDEDGDIDEMVMPKEYQCPTNILFKKGQDSYYRVLVSYAYNVSDWGGNPNPGMDFNCFWYPCCGCTTDARPNWQIGHKRTAIKNASEKINFTDSSDWWCTWWGANYEIAWDIGGQISAFSVTGPSYWDINIWGPVLYRHNEGANFAFYDGHVKYLPKQQAYIEQEGDDPPERDATGMWYVLEW